MFQTQSHQRSDPRASKLRSHLNKILSGETGIHRSRDAKLFVEAICILPEPVQCIERLISSPKGLGALQTALGSDTSLEFLNDSASAFVKYLQAPELMVTCQGEFLRSLILTITDPPIFWDAFVKAFKSGGLTDEAVQCFSWLLLQLITLPTDKAVVHYGIAKDPSIQKMLLGSTQLDVRTAAQKILHVLNTITNPTDFQGDGPGGRHDNDFTDIRKISIMPTPDEIAAEEAPYLRQAIEIDECPSSGRLSMHIDNQFRLLREDMLRDLREELQVALGSKKGRRKGILIDGLFVEGLDCDKRQPWAIRLQCSKDLPQLRNVKSHERKKWVTEHYNWLKHQSVACLIADGKMCVLGKVNRNEDLLAHQPPIITLQLAGGQDCVSKALIKLKSTKQIKLIQLNTAIFSYEPVLQQLQRMNQLLLSEEVMLWAPNKAIRTVPLAEHTSIVDLVRKLQIDPSHQLQTLLQLPNSTKLDESQAECLKTGLTQRLTLVQGPPGTGKSFIGALIAKAIYLFSEQIILVVCYTNHALDQFLEDLLKVQIPADSVVRLGSPTKATTLTQQLLLSSQQSTFKATRNRSEIINNQKTKMAADAVRLRRVFGEYQAKSLSKTELMQQIEFDSEYSSFYDAFVLPENDDGMKRIGKNGKTIDKFYLLDQWARGQDAGVYKGMVEAEFPKVWKLPAADRQKLLMKWKSEILEERVSKLYNDGNEFNDTVSQIETLYSEKDRSIIQQKRIIGCTTTAAAKYVRTIQSASPGVVLVEEAGEILESHILTALGANTDQLILIGDHKQLRPKAHHALSVEKGDGFDLNRSLFERLVLREYPHQALSQQHRMRPEISNLVRQLTYPDLKDAPSTKGRPNLQGFQNNLIFVNHEHAEDDTPDHLDPRDGFSTSSKKNQFEANMTLKCVKYLAQQGYGSDRIVVLTPYVAQLRLLMDVLSTENDPVLNDLDSYNLVMAGLMPAATANMNKRKLRLSTIDNYQGEESDIVVISLTRCNDRGDIGFLSSPERLNVLLSRARNAMILLGNAKTFLESRRGKDLWGRFMSLLRDGSHIHDGFPVKCERHPDRMSLLQSPKDFDECPDGGCTEPCPTLLNCGVHLCPSRCHQLSDHSKMSCRSVISSKCSSGHPQKWQCGKGKPPSCRQCEHEKELQEKKLQDELTRQQKREQEQQEHAKQMAKLEEELRVVREAAADDQRAQEMKQSLLQKRKDLEDAKRVASRVSQLSAKVFGPESSNNGETRQQKQSNSAASNGETNYQQKQSTFAAESISVDGAQDIVTAPEDKPRLSPSELEWDRQKRLDNTFNEAIDSLMQMTGLEEVKTQVLRIKARIDAALRQNTNVKDERYGIVLLGNPGTGKTTVARLYAKFLTSMGVLPGTEFIETSGSRLASDGVPGAKNHIETLIKAGGGCLFLDEAYQLASGNSYGGAAVLDFILAEIENQTGKIVFILAGYNKQMEKFFEHNQGFTSRIPYQLQFADYNDRELLQMLSHRLEKRYHGNMKVEGGVMGLYARIAVRRLGRGRGREGFGNARALENMLAKIAERQADRLQQERSIGAQPDDFLLRKEDLIGPEPSRAITESSAWKELQGLTGLKAVKESLQGLLDRISLNYQRELAEKETVEVSLNRVFLGSPGTGKTSVGKLYGRLLADMGILSNGEVVVKNPADFVGSVLGESEKNTKAILKATEGKVLIIDEAYMLFSGVSGLSSTSDPYKTAVIDTIVAEVQSTLGEDRCVLLLGYKEQMEEMFQNTNPGLSRRFPLDDAFHFENFDDDQLREILETKLKKQGLDATKEAKDVAISVLSRARQRPNFGNAGEVENIISHAKASQQSRQSAKPSSARSIDIVFEPQDFDANFDRSTRADVNCRELFKDVLGCDDITDKLEGFVRTVNKMRARGLEPRQHIPFNFIFKGPPGTGKTTTARKMGQVFYDMGFLSTPDVHECSATDMIAGFVGQTGQKTVKLMEKALGKVLFVDEAYRLGEGQFATEAINELVDSLTKPRFMGKIVVILAGYESDMNNLLTVNQGLSSRFSEEVMFKNMEPQDSWKFLQRNLQKTGIIIKSPRPNASNSEIMYLFEQLTNLPSWGNGRDIETISKSITNATFRQAGDPTAELSVSHQDIIKALTVFLAERRSRVSIGNPKVLRQEPLAQAVQDKIDPPKVSRSSTANAETGAETTPLIPASEEPSPDKDHLPERDAGVTDAIWNQLQADKAAQESRGLQQNAVMAATEAQAKKAADDAGALEIELAEQKVKADKEAAAISQRIVLEKAKANKEAAALAEKLAAQRAKAHNEELERIKRLLEAARLNELKARREKEEAERRRKEDQAVQTKLRYMGLCVAGFQWIKQSGGYRCAGGSHFVSDQQLGI